jgi:hypothetical protein
MEKNVKNKVLLKNGAAWFLDSPWAIGRLE